MASVVEICNRALQELGVKRIGAITEDSRNGRACDAAYEVLRDRELRAHPWSFAVKRVQMAADATAPVFRKTNSFLLPADFLRLLPLDPVDVLNTLDWQIEGRYLVTNDSAPLNFRYIYRVTDPAIMDVLFREALSMLMAWKMAEEITQSNTKKAAAKAAYDEAIADAKKVNAIERIAMVPQEDTYITVRV